MSFQMEELEVPASQPGGSALETRRVGSVTYPCSVSGGRPA